MTTGLLLQTILVLMVVIAIGCICFSLLFDKDWLMYAGLSVFILIFLFVIVLSFMYQNLQHVWNAPL